MSDAPSRDNRQLLLPYLAPYFAYVGVASLVAAFGADLISHELDYAIRLVLTSAALVWAWRFYVPLRGPRSPLGSVAVGVVAGLVGLALWIALLAAALLPFLLGGVGTVVGMIGAFDEVVKLGPAVTPKDLAAGSRSAAASCISKGSERQARGWVFL